MFQFTLLTLLSLKTKYSYCPALFSVLCNYERTDFERICLALGPGIQQVVIPDVVLWFVC